MTGSGDDGVAWAGTEHPFDARTVDAVNVEDDDLSPLALLRDLEVLRTRWTNPHVTPVRLPTDLAPLAHLTRLRLLELPGWEIDDLGPLARLAALEELDVRGARVRDLDPLAGLPRLRRLVLDRCPVRDLTPLHGMDSLEVVSVRETRVTADEAERLRQAVPGIAVLE